MSTVSLNLSVSADRTDPREPRVLLTGVHRVDDALTLAGGFVLSASAARNLAKSLVAVADSIDHMGRES